VSSAKVSIAVPTYRRPDLLKTLLRLLMEQLTECADDEIRILVVDNDPGGSARAATEAMHSNRVAYIQERRPGVAAVRNRALREAWSDDAVIFIDDDQLPGAGWLRSMLRSWRRYGADAVAGPVVSELPAGADDWIRAGGFFDRSYRNRLKTGDRIDEVATTNLLLDMVAVRSRQLIFDERFGLSGGEDSLFTRSLSSSGGLIIWSTESRVTEPVPESRLSRTWLSRRALSSGNGAARVRIALQPSVAGRTRTRVTLLGKGIARWVGGAVKLIDGLLRKSDRRRGRAARTMLRGVGMCLGSLGIIYLEYARDGRRWQFGQGRLPHIEAGKENEVCQ
jgi:glycosyltransferase involved in cell wall biosynthesis